MSIADNLNDRSSCSSDSDEPISNELSGETDSINIFVKKHRIENFIEVIYLYDATDFKRHFRLSRRKANILIEAYKTSPLCPKHKNGGREKVAAEKEVYIFLWYIANNYIAYKQVANLFGISYKTAWSVINRLSYWVLSVADTYIKWPQEDAQYTTQVDRLKAMAASNF